MLKNPISVTIWTEKERNTVSISGELCRWNDIVLKMKRKENKIDVFLSAEESRPCFMAIRFEMLIGSGWR